MPVTCKMNDIAKFMSWICPSLPAQRALGEHHFPLALALNQDGPRWLTHS